MDHILLDMERTLPVPGGLVETLRQRMSALETFVLSKTWYVAHLFPLATSVSNPVLVALLSPRQDISQENILDRTHCYENPTYVFLFWE